MGESLDADSGMGFRLIQRGRRAVVLRCLVPETDGDEALCTREVAEYEGRR